MAQTDGAASVSISIEVCGNSAIDLHMSSECKILNGFAYHLGLEGEIFVR